MAFLDAGDQFLALAATAEPAADDERHFGLDARSQPSGNRTAGPVVYRRRGSHSLGTVCICQASSPEKIREHASRVGMPADEITEVLDTVLVRPDPEPANV